MNRIILFIPIVSIAILAACNSKKPNLKLTAQVAQNSDNTILSSEPSENVSVEDYWDEANSIRSVAQQLIQRSTNANCTIAKNQAQLSISFCAKAKITQDKNEAEVLIGNANEALSQAENALAICEEKIDSEYPAK